MDNVSRDLSHPSLCSVTLLQRAHLKIARSNSHEGSYPEAYSIHGS